MDRAEARSLLYNLEARMRDAADRLWLSDSDEVEEVSIKVAEDLEGYADTLYDRLNE